MSNKKDNISPDELFQKKLQNEEVAFDEAAWEHMRNLLDKESEKVPFIWMPEKKLNKNKIAKLIIIIMIALSIISVATWWSQGMAGWNGEKMMDDNTKIVVPENAVAEAPTVPEYKSEAKESASNGHSSIDKDANNNGIVFSEKSNGTVSKRETSGTSALFKKHLIANEEETLPSMVSAKTETTTGTKLLENENAETAVDTPKIGNPAGKYHKVVIRKVWVPATYEYVTLPKARTIQDFWMGMHFTFQNAAFERNWDSVDRYGASQGFNIQFMSGNRLKSKNWAAYGGIDWGMQFYGRTPNTNVVLNTVREDSGYTRLRTNSMDFLFRTHWEYARFPIVPYFNLMGGPRFFSTRQKVASYLNLTETESSTSHNVHLSASMMFGAGVGVRAKVTKCISIDVRYEMLYGTNVKLVDMERTNFNGLNYNLQTHKVAPVFSQIKIGVIFDLSASETERREKTPGYYREEVYDSLYSDPSDSSVRYLPCPCVPCVDKKKEPTKSVPQNNNNDNNDDSNDNTPVINPTRPGNGSGKGSGGKESFPGIKTPPAPPKPKA